MGRQHSTALFLMLLAMALAPSGTAIIRQHMVSRLRRISFPLLEKQRAGEYYRSFGKPRALFCSASSGNHNNDDDDTAHHSLKSYHLQGIGSRSRVEIKTSTGHTLMTDVPKTMGGTDSAPQPVETLLAAFLGCTQATAVFVGRHMKPQRVILDRLEFKNILAVRDERGALQLPIHEIPELPSRLQRISGTVFVFAKTGLTNEQLRELHEQTEARCPVANMILASGCEIDVEWVDGYAKNKNPGCDGLTPSP